MVLGDPLIREPVREPLSHMGVTFTPTYRMVISGRHYIIPLEIKTSTLIQPLNKATNITADIKWNLDHIDDDYYIIGSLKRTVKSFSHEFHKLFNELNDFLDYITNQRPYNNLRVKRGALNFMGTLSNYLFGTATQNQIDAIHEQINNLHLMSERERQMLNVHSTILNSTMREMRSLQAGITRLEMASVLTRKVIREFSVKTRKINEAEKLLEALLHLQLAIFDINHDILNLKLGLQDMIEAKLSTFIIPNDVLLSILRDAYSKVSGLLFPITPDFLGLWRDFITVSIRYSNTPGTINFYLSLPLQGDPNDMFDVFRIQSLPYPIPGSNYFMQMQTQAKYIVVSENRKRYFLMSNIEHCHRSHILLICEPSSPIYDTKVDTCESTLFLKKRKSKDKCKKTILKTFNPTLVRGQGGWIFAVPKPMVLTLNCPVNALSKFRQTLNSTGTLILGRGCSAHSDSFSLPAQDNMVQTELLTVTPAPILPTSYLTKEDYTLLRNVTDVLEDLGQRDNITHQAIQFEDFQQQLRLLQPQSSPPPPADVPVWAYILLGLIFTLLVVSLIGWYYYKLCIAHKSQQQQDDERKDSTRPRGRGLRKGGTSVETTGPSTSPSTSPSISLHVPACPK